MGDTGEKQLLRGAVAGSQDPFDPHLRFKQRRASNRTTLILHFRKDRKLGVR
jgi:hypothetical protein